MTLYGELTLGEQRGGTAYVVELRGLDSRPSPGLRAHVNDDGSFEFRHIQPGSYELHVTTQHGNPVRTDIIQVNAHSNRITVRMEKRRGFETQRDGFDAPLAVQAFQGCA